MVRLTVTPRKSENLYGLLVKKEVELRRKKKGTLHRWAAKQREEARWVHTSYPGWIRFHRCLGGVLVAQVNSKKPDDEWQLLSSFVGFLHRHFKESIASINLSYCEDE